MSNKFFEKNQTKKNDFSEENININNTNLGARTEFINNDLSQSEEEEIIDELINRKISNNICTLNMKKLVKKLPSKTKSYKLKSGRTCHSADSIKSRKMKLKDWLNNNIENTRKIEEDIEDLIIEIFVNRYNSYPEKEYPLPENALESKKQIDLYCSKFYEFSIYLLYVIYLKFYSFFEYLSKKINFKSLPISDLNKIKEILILTGIDIKLVFKKAFEKTSDFNLSSILIIMFDEYLVKENKIKICKEIKNSQFYKEKEKFENYLKLIKQNIYFFDSDNESGVVEKGNIIDSKIYNENNLDENNQKENDNVDEIGINNEVSKDDIQSKEITKEENYDINNQSDKENKVNNNDNHNNNGVNKENNKNKNIEKNENIQNLNIDDLVNYINDSENKENKKKKKKKKKGKKQENKIEEKQKQENDYIEEDLVYLNYKQTLEEYTKSVIKTKKIKPQYSEAFLKKIQILSQ